jgi:hypothetical protein
MFLRVSREPQFSILESHVNASTMVDDCLALAMKAQRTAIHTALRLSPGAFVFQRDMLLDIPLIAANMELIRERRQHLINEQLR